MKRRGIRIRLKPCLAALLLCACAASHVSTVKDPVALRLDLARALVAKQQWAPASGLLVDIVKQRPRDPEAHALLGTAYREQGVFEGAEAEYATAIALDPQCHPAWAGRGVLRVIRRDAGDDGLADLEKAIAIHETATYDNNLGFALYLRGRYLDAVTAFRRGLRLDPTEPRMRNNLGFAYGRLGAFNRAWLEFQRGGRPAEAQSNLGFVYEEAGKRDDACRAYVAAQQLEPTSAAIEANVRRTCAAPSDGKELSWRLPPDPPTGGEP